MALMCLFHKKKPVLLEKRCRCIWEQYPIEIQKTLPLRHGKDHHPIFMPLFSCGREYRECIGTLYRECSCGRRDIQDVFRLWRNPKAWIDDGVLPNYG